MGPNSAFYRALSSLTDLVIINLLTLAGCLPIVTAGASLTATSRAMNEVVRERDGYIARTWWRSFKGNLRQSLAWWVPTAVLLAGAWWENRALASTSSPTLAGALTGLLLAAVLLIVALLAWVVPLTALFTNAVWGHLTNAAILAIRHPGRTILCLALAAAPLLVLALLPGARTATLWFMGLIGIAFVSYLAALIQKHVIDELLSAAEAGTEETPSSQNL